MKWWMFVVICGVLCCLSEARPHEKKHGTLYNDPGYIGYWRPPVNKIYVPEKETKSSETRGDKSVGLTLHEPVHPEKGENTAGQKSTEKSGAKSTTLNPNHQTQNQEVDRVQTDHGEVPHTESENSSLQKAHRGRITSVKLTIRDDGSPSKWSDQMKEFIREVYGDKLPYTETDVVLDSDIGKVKVTTDNTVKESQAAQTEAKPSTTTAESLQNQQKTTQRSGTLLRSSEGTVKKVSNDSMRKVIERIQNDQSSEEEQGTATNEQTEKEEAKISLREKEKVSDVVLGQKQKVRGSKVSSTTAAPSTRPNPPTTRPTRVTPVSERKTKQRKTKHILSRPHVSCSSDRDCPSGRVCHKRSCVCGDSTLCSKHAHAVCGSDGVVYPSHCELHRQACLEQKHIKIDSGEACASHQKAPQIAQQSARNNSIVRADRKCSYEQMKLNSENMYMMCDVSVSFTKDIIGCQSACRECKAFTYIQNGGVCQVYYDESCVNMLNTMGKNHYIKHCHNTETNSSCHVLEVTPGRSPYMCSKATSTLSTLLDCHDTCLRGHCEAFKFLNNGFCEIYFDKSCIEMLEKGRENYYVRRCANPEDCSYHEVQLPASAPCEIRSNKISSFEDCRDSCEDCIAIKYDYNTGDCHLYNQESCITQKSVNYIKRDCGETKGVSTEREPTLHRVKRPDGKAQLKAHLTVKDEDKTGVILPSEKPDQNQKEPEIKLSLEKVTSKQPTEKGQYDNALDPKTLKDRVEEAMFSDLCTTQEYVKMKADILRYHCVRFQEKDCSPTALYGKRDYLASLMFSYYDKNMDNKIIRDELWDIWVTEPFQRMFASCSLMDMFRFENIQDDEIQEDEFLKAFDLEIAAFEEEFQEVPTLATVGNGLELRCGISPSSENSHIIWNRHNTDLETVAFPGIAVFSDGTLYFENVGIHHIGNWTCYDQYRPGFKQVHELKVNVPPIVKVSPSSMMLPVSGVDIHLHCQGVGIPPPTIQWQFNDKVIPASPDHYARIHENGTLIIKDSNYQRDSGAYKCVATNPAGSSQDIAMLYIQKPNQTEKLYGKQTTRQETFFVFHQTGYSAYNPSGCYTKRQVHSSFGHLKYIPEELDGPIYLCDQRKDCVWGQVVNVRNKFLYIAQPSEHRVVVIDSAETMNPVEFINTDQFPTKLYYVEHLDEVWVLCWNSETDTGSKTVVVIRDASSDLRHRMVHTQPVGYKFHLVQDMFLPPANDLHHNQQYGYVIHRDQHSMFKLELESMRYTKAVDLDVFNCVPQEVAFIPLGGHIVVECLQSTPSGSKTLQILIDYITDTPVSNVTLSGTPYVSPDSKNIVTVDKQTGKVNIAKVTGKGEISKMTEVIVDSKVSDVTFFPSNQGHGYKVVMTSQELPEIYSIQLDNGKMTTLKDIGEPQMSLNSFTQVSRAVIGGDYFSRYFATPSKDTLLILNGQSLYKDCQLSGLKNPNKVAYNVASLV
ncbi:follistatin-related protein 5-like isoform X3 [Saccostrea cucullata]|uniref:follistatin-related protein 5-like isoform X3 n=1 Tax=Saccostrea cuccullata TaxID=36930 RepID=UPI002ED587F7